MVVVAVATATAVDWRVVAEANCQPILDTLISLAPSCVRAPVGRRLLLTRERQPCGSCRERWPITATTGGAFSVTLTTPCALSAARRGLWSLVRALGLQVRALTLRLRGCVLRLRRAQRPGALGVTAYEP